MTKMLVYEERPKELASFDKTNEVVLLATSWVINEIQHTDLTQMSIIGDAQ